MSDISLWEHPFKKGVRVILKQHFTPSIAKKFKLALEGQLYKDSKDVKQMVGNNMIVMEVHYKDGETQEYVCDLYGWESKRDTEIRILRGVSDAHLAGRIGKNWTEKGNLISEEVKSGKHATKDELQDNKKSRN